jgi:hypothetical protein
MELLRDFEETLSRLIENQETLNAISEKEQLAFEHDALLKTQESLKAHIIFLSDIYPKEKKHLKGTYIKEQLLLEKFSYLKKISNLQVNIPFASPFHLRKHRFKRAGAKKPTFHK